MARSTENANARELSGHVGLACAILARAWRDARSTNGVRQDALLFLESDGAGAMVDLLSDVLDMAIDPFALRGLVHELGEGGRLCTQ